VQASDPLGGLIDQFIAYPKKYTKIKKEEFAQNGHFFFRVLILNWGGEIHYGIHYILSTKRRLFNINILFTTI
jgi:hypothetical protein